MAACIAAKTEVAVILAGQRTAGSTVLWWGRNLVSMGDACAGTGWAVTVVAAETAEADVIPRAGTGDAHCPRGRRRCGAGAHGAGGGCRECG